MDEVFEYLHSCNRKDLDNFLGKKWKWKLDRIKMMRSKKKMKKTRRRHKKKMVDLIATT